MRYQLRALQLSVALHAAIIMMVIISMNNSFVRTNKLMVIDLTTEDLINNAGSKNKSMKRLSLPSYQKKEIRNQKQEIIKQKSEPEDLRLEPLLSLNGSNQKASSVEVLIHSEESPESKYEVVQNLAGGYSKSSVDAVEGLMREAGGMYTDKKAGSGIDTKNMSDLGRLGYLKANFIYIKDMINKKITYPRMARQMGWEGKVKASFIVSSDGFVKEIKILKSSGFEILDKNAIEAIKSASPFPKPPVEAQIIIPIIYKLN